MTVLIFLLRAIMSIVIFSILFSIHISINKHPSYYNRLSIFYLITFSIISARCRLLFCRRRACRDRLAVVVDHSGLAWPLPAAARRAARRRRRPVSACSTTPARAAPRRARAAAAPWRPPFHAPCSPTTRVVFHISIDFGVPTPDYITVCLYIGVVLAARYHVAAAGWRQRPWTGRRRWGEEEHRGPARWRRLRCLALIAPALRLHRATPRLACAGASSFAAGAARCRAAGRLAPSRLSAPRAACARATCTWRYHPFYLHPGRPIILLVDSYDLCLVLHHRVAPIGFRPPLALLPYSPAACPRLLAVLQLLQKPPMRAFLTAYRALRTRARAATFLLLLHHFLRFAVLAFATTSRHGVFIHHPRAARPVPASRGA